jgi:hypothetical protein
MLRGTASRSLFHWLFERFPCILLLGFRLKLFVLIFSEAVGVREFWVFVVEGLEGLLTVK